MLRRFLIGLIPLVSAAAFAVGAEKLPSPIGRKVADFSLADHRGRTWSLAEFRDSKAVVVLFTGVECPLAAAYAPRIQELSDKYASRGVAFLAIDANQRQRSVGLRLVQQHRWMAEVGVRSSPAHAWIRWLGDAEHVRTEEVDAHRPERSRLPHHGRRLADVERITDVPFGHRHVDVLKPRV